MFNLLFCTNASASKEAFEEVENRDGLEVSRSICNLTQSGLPVASEDRQCPSANSPVSIGSPCPPPSTRARIVTQGFGSFYPYFFKAGLEDPTIPCCGEVFAFMHY